MDDEFCGDVALVRAFFSVVFAARLAPQVTTSYTRFADLLPQGKFHAIFYGSCSVCLCECPLSLITKI